MGRLLLGLAGWKGRLVCSRHVPAGPISLLDLPAANLSSTGSPQGLVRVFLLRPCSLVPMAPAGLTWAFTGLPASVSVWPSWQNQLKGRCHLLFKSPAGGVMGWKELWPGILGRMTVTTLEKSLYLSAS